MAAPQVVVTLQSIELTRRHKYMIYSIQLVGAGPTYTAGGVIVDFTLATIGPFKARYRTALLPLPLPKTAEIEQLNDVIGWSPTLTPNTVSPTLKNFLFRLWNGTTEATGSYAAGTFATTLGAAPSFLF